jgi:hypothetical protein
MKQLFNIIAVYLPSLLFSQSSLSDFSYLLGKWQIIDEAKGKITKETWIFEGDNFIGNSFTLTNGIKTFEENMELSIKDGKFVYSVNNPGNDSWVHFTQETKSANGLSIFENRSHDFPKYISYKSKGNHGIEAEIGDFSQIKIPYSFEKVQDDDSIQIHSVFSLMQMKYYLGDMDGVANHYDEESMIVGGNTFIEGKEQIKKYWSFFQRGKWQLDSDWLNINGDTAVQRGRSTITYDGDRPQDKVEFLINWIKKEGQWLIKQDIYW